MVSQLSKKRPKDVLVLKSQNTNISGLSPYLYNHKDPHAIVMSQTKTSLPFANSQRTKHETLKLPNQQDHDVGKVRAYDERD